MPRFLHTADWQIGRQFGRFEPDDSAELAAARLTAVQRIAALATERLVDAVLVAGDSFDFQTVSDKLLRRTFQAMAEFNGPWILIPGNHDAALAESVWTRAEQFGLLTPNIHLLDKPLVADFTALGFAVLPAPLTQRQSIEDLTEWFDTGSTKPDLIRIGLGHGSVSGRLPEAAEHANPIHPERATLARLDYLALGDWHGCLSINDRTWYSGTPEAERFKANEPGYVLEVQIDSPGSAPHVKRHRIGRYHWHRHVLRISPQDGLAPVHELLAPLGDTDVLRLKLSGRIGITMMNELNKLLDQSEATVAAMSRDVSQLVLLPQDDEIDALEADGYLGRVLTTLRREVSELNGSDEAANNNTALGHKPVTPVAPLAPILREALGILTQALSERREQNEQGGAR